MTTIIYKAGRLYADSRITDVDPVTQEVKEGSYDDECVKIFEPTHLYVGNRKVLAVALSGDFCMMQYTQMMNNACAEHNEYSDLLDVRFLQAVQPYIHHPTCMFIVTPSRNFSIVLTPNQEPVWNNYKVIQSIQVGTGARFIKPLDAHLDVKLVMAEVFTRDIASGGNIKMWRYGTTGVREVPPPKHFLRLRRLVSYCTEMVADTIHFIQLVNARKNVYPKTQYV